jgi:hypothetical protein
MSPRWGSTPRLTDCELDWRVESQLPIGHSHGKFVVEGELEGGQ